MTLALVNGGGGGHNDADDNGYDSNDDNSDVLMMITLDIAVELDLTHLLRFSLYLISPVCSLNNGFLVADMCHYTLPCLSVRLSIHPQHF